MIWDFFQGIIKWKSAPSLPRVTVPTESGYAAHRASWKSRQTLGGGVHKCLRGPPSPGMSGLKVEPAPSPVSRPYSQPPPTDLHVTALARFPPGAAEGLEPPSPRTRPGAESSEGCPCQVRPHSQPHLTSAYLGSPWGGSAHPAPTLEGSVGGEAQSQEGPLGKMTARPWGQACGACSRQEFSWPEITASAPLHSCPRPELATPGDWMLLPWEQAWSAPRLLLPCPHSG